MGVTFWLWVLIVLACIVYIYKYVTRNFNYWTNQNVSSLKPFFLFGNFFKVATLQQSLGQFAKEVYDHTDSKYTGFFIFDQPFLLIRDPMLIKNILISDFDHFDDRGLAENHRDDPIGSKVLFVMKNPLWKHVRTKLTPAFTSGKLKRMLPLMLEVSEDLKAYIDERTAKSQVIESREMSMKYTTDILSSCCFGINSRSFKYENADFRVATRKFFALNLSRSLQMASYMVAHSLVKPFRMKLVEPVATKFMQSVFTEHMQQRKASNLKRGDLIDILLQMKDDDDEDLDADVLFAQAIQFVVAGFETTGSSISFTLYELALNKGVQTQLRKEINTTIAAHGEISYKAIMEMKYLDNVVRETLRKYPGLPLVNRRCTKQYNIPNSSLTIPKGLPVYISLLGLHMDPKYFPEPEKYNPDRFSDENKNFILPCTYMPFGEGSRNCIGARFGLLATKVALIAIFSGFEVKLHQSTPVPMYLDPKSGFMIAPKGGVINLCFCRLT